MATSLLLMFFEIAGVKFERVGFLGTELVIGRPEVLGSALWVVWGYFFLRYCQYLSAQKDLEITRLIRKRMDAYASKHFDLRAFQSSVGEMIRYEIQHVKTLQWTFGHTELPVYQDEEKLVVFPNFGVTRFSIWWLRAFVRISFTSTKVTDYLLPLWLAACTFAVGMWGALR